MLHWVWLKSSISPRKLIILKFTGHLRTKNKNICTVMILLLLLRSPLLWHIDTSKADLHSEWNLPKKKKWWQTLIITDEHAYFSFADKNQRPLYIDSHKFVKNMFFFSCLPIAFKWMLCLAVHLTVLFYVKKLKDFICEPIFSKMTFACI